jgi:hypothetical protein
MRYNAVYRTFCDAIKIRAAAGSLPSHFTPAPYAVYGLAMLRRLFSNNGFIADQQHFHPTSRCSSPPLQLRAQTVYKKDGLPKKSTKRSRRQPPARMIATRRPAARRERGCRPPPSLTTRNIALIPRRQPRIGRFFQPIPVVPSRNSRCPPCFPKNHFALSVNK